MTRPTTKADADRAAERDRPGGTDFIRSIVESDLRSGKYDGRVVTRFPPEPNGYLHIGHAKSICLNFGVAEEYGGVCHLRFDDTNPTTEDLKYVESIENDVRWLGYDWDDRLFFASDYFEQLYDYAIRIIEDGRAYVDSQSEDEIREQRGTVTEPGRESPHRARSVEENLELFRAMRAGEFPNGTHVLRAKIDMAAPNMLMRDPLLYRIRHATHYRRGDEWCIYPMYDFAHCLSDAIEGVTHSLCTLEFKDNRALYDWVLDAARIEHPRPQQIEFARLNLDYTVMSKRKLARLVADGDVSGWDDPRLPTLAGLRRRGVTPEAIRAFCDLIGVAKTDSRVDMGKLEYCIRDDLNRRAPRVMCVLRPLRVVIDNYPERETEQLDAPYYPEDIPREESRKVPFSRVIYIDRDDFREDPPKGYHRLAPGREVRLRYAYFIECVDVVKDPTTGEVTEVHCTYDPATRGGSAPDGRKVRGTLHWVCAEHALTAEVRLYDRLFVAPDPEDLEEGEDFRSKLNPESLVTLRDARIEPSVAADPPGTRYQFERVGYFHSDPGDSAPAAPVFNRTVALRDTWAKVEQAGRPSGSGTAPDRSRADDGKKGERPAKSGTGAPTRTKRTAERGPEFRARFRRYTDEYGLGAEDADSLAQDDAAARLFEEALAVHDDAQAVANLIVNDLFAHAKGRAIADLPFDGARLGSLVRLIESNAISRTAGKAVLETMVETGGDPGRIVEERSLERVADPDELAPVVREIVARHPDKADAYRKGKTGLLGFFVGEVVRETGGQADPKLVKKLIREQLS